MGKMEDLLAAIDPLVLTTFDISGDRYYFRPFIRYDIILNMADVYISPVGGGRGSILLRSDMNKTHDIYFILFGWKSFKFIRYPQKHHTVDGRFVFSAPNVFQSLNLSALYDNLPPGPLEDLHTLCMRIKENWPKIHEAFSDERVSATYDALKCSEGNDEEEINHVFMTLFPNWPH
jgi:hypothetical protein